MLYEKLLTTKSERGATLPHELKGKRQPMFTFTHF